MANQFRRALVQGQFSFIICLAVSAMGTPAEQQNATADYMPVPLSLHSRQWQQVTLETNQLGKVRAKTNSYTELQMGLFYQQDGQYHETEEKIEITAQGAQAIHGPHQAYFASDIATAGGALTLVTPDNKQFVSRVLGISLFDPSTGQSALIAEVKSAIGQIIGDNEVVYADAFNGAVKADVRYRYKKSGFSQDIILREQLNGTPADYGLGPDSRLEILTEFFSPPEAVKSSRVTDGITDDTKLNFGAMYIAQGKAFLLPGQGQPETAVNAVEVQKTWTQMNGRDFLIESVKLSSIADQLETLPKRVAAANPAGNGVRRVASVKREWPKATAALAQKGTMTVAKVKSNRPGYNLDYDFLHSTTLTNYIFKGDSTYLIAGEVDLAGTTIFEGGCVIKYTNDAAAVLSVSNAVWNTGPYRPCWFGSMHDDTVGQIVTGSTGRGWTNYSGYMALKFSTNATVHDVRFSNLARAIDVSDGATITVTNFQMVHCQSGFVGAQITGNLFNGLSYQVGTLFDQICGGPCNTNGCVILGENLTLHGIGNFAQDTNSTAKLTNCLAVQVTNLSACASIATNGTAILASDTGIFQTVGAGSHYLADGSIYLEGGTTNIDAGLRADLRMKTTYPPFVYENSYYGTTAAFEPQAPRDTEGKICGYHYDCLDYVFGQVAMTNCTITLLPGTAVGIYSSGSMYGIWPYSSANIISEGTATSPVWMARYNCVQEQSNTNWSYSTAGPDLYFNGGSPQFNFKFTRWSVMAKDCAHCSGPGGGITLPFKDCQFYGGSVFSLGSTLHFTNCLFARVSTTLEDADEIHPVLRNNTFVGGDLTLNNWMGETWVCQDNLFDRTALSQLNDVGASYNGYVTTNYGRLMPTNAHDVVLTDSPAWPHNALRHSFGSYLFAKNKNENLTSAEMGNSPAMVFKHYRAIVKAEDMENFWNIKPAGKKKQHRKIKV